MSQNCRRLLRSSLPRRPLVDFTNKRTSGKQLQTPTLAPVTSGHKRNASRMTQTIAQLILKKISVGDDYPSFFEGKGLVAIFPTKHY